MLIHSPRRNLGCKKIIRLPVLPLSGNCGGINLARVWMKSISVAFDREGERGWRYYTTVEIAKDLVSNGDKFLLVDPLDLLKVCVTKSKFVITCSSLLGQQCDIWRLAMWLILEIENGTTNVQN